MRLVRRKGKKKEIVGEQGEESDDFHPRASQSRDRPLGRASFGMISLRVSPSSSSWPQAYTHIPLSVITTTDRLVSVCLSVWCDIIILVILTKLYYLLLLLCH